MATLIEQNSEALKNNFPREFLIKIYTKLASFYLEQGIRLQQEERASCLEKVRKIFYRTDHVNINEKRSFLLKGFYYLFQNQLEKSRDHFDNAHGQDNRCLPYMFGKGLIEFHNKRYSRALEHFQQIYIHFRV